MHVYQNFRRKLAYRSAIRKIRHLKKAEALAEIDRMIVAFGEKIPYLRNLRTDLVPSVSRALRYIGSIVGRIPGPVSFDPENWSVDPLLNGICVSEERIRAVLRSSRVLQHYFENNAGDDAFALLIAEKFEKTVSGIEQEGEIVRRDVLQKAVFFDNHEILAPAGDLEDCRRTARSWLLAALFRQGAEQIDDLKFWKSELQEQHDRMEAKLGGHAASHHLRAPSAGDEDGDQSNAATLHDAIEEKLTEIENDLDAPDDYLAHLTQVLTNPERHLTVRSISLKLSRLGIRLGDSSKEPANQFCLAELETGPDNKRVAVWIRVRRETIMNGNAEV
jgi:hypothetical protein